MTGFVHVQDGLDFDNGAQIGTGSRYSAAPLEEHQVIHREPVHDVQPVFFHPLGVLFQSQTFLPLLQGIVHQQTFAHGGTQAVHNGQLPLRVLFLQLFHSLHTGCVGTAQAAGEGNHQHVLTLVEQLADLFFPLLHVDLGSGKHLAST